MIKKLVAIGAEAIILQDDCQIIKRRIKKSYRIREIDEKLRKLRTRSEGKIMDKLLGIINIPKILKVDEKNKEIVMEFIEGKKLSDNLDSFPLNKQEKIAGKIGEEISKIHNQNIVHGDLTTSNMILVEPENRQEKTHSPATNNLTTKNPSEDVRDLVISDNKSLIENKMNLDKPMSNSSLNLVINNEKLTRNKRAGGADEEGNFKIFLIDFGLGFSSSRVEDKAVDLHLLRQALESRHFQNWKSLFEKIIEAYNSKDKDKILKQLEKVEKRGRYKH